MARYFQLEPFWDTDPYDKRGRRLPKKVVVDAEKINMFDYYERQGALRDCFAELLEARYGYHVAGLSFCNVQTKRGIPLS
jgi:hypothetical protein